MSHLSDLERYRFASMMDERGVSEVLRQVGSYVAHVAADIAYGDEMRQRINLLAKDLENFAQRD
jgi:hypothetical protein